MEDFYDSQGRNDQFPSINAEFGDFYRLASKFVAERIDYLPQFLRVVTEFGSSPVDNVDERAMLCEAAHYVYKRRPTEYVRAVGRIELRYRRDALGFRKGCNVP